MLKLIITMSSSTIAALLTYIFNCSIKQQIFPKAFKQAKVTPIYKKGDMSNTTNYRPISVLHVISLIFEKLPM